MSLKNFDKYRKQYASECLRISEHYEVLTSEEGYLKQEVKQLERLALDCKCKYCGGLNSLTPRKPNLDCKFCSTARKHQQSMIAQFPHMAFLTTLQEILELIKDLKRVEFRDIYYRVKCNVCGFESKVAQRTLNPCRGCERTQIYYTYCEESAQFGYEILSSVEDFISHEGNIHQMTIKVKCLNCNEGYTKQYITKLAPCNKCHHMKIVNRDERIKSICENRKVSFIKFTDKLHFECKCNLCNTQFEAPLYSRPKTEFDPLCTECLYDQRYIREVPCTDCGVTLKGGVYWFKQRNRKKLYLCGSCSTRRRRETHVCTEQQVRDRCRENGYLLLSDYSEYTDCFSDLRFECIKCKKEFIRRFDSVDRTEPKCLHCLKTYVSKCEIDLSECVKSLGVEIVQSARKLIQPHEIDIFIPSHGLGIELDGLYYHSELNGRKPNSYHKMKTDKMNAKGLELIHITDYEWLNKTDIMKSMLRAKLGLTETNLAARKMEIVSVDKQVAFKFFESNHRQGGIYSKYSYGLELEGNLVCVLGVSKHSMYQYTISRFASTLNTNIMGGFSKLLAHFIKNHSPETIMSYMDLRLSSLKKNVYISNGFTLSHISRPNYWYFKTSDGIMHSRLKFQKHKLKGLLNVFNPEKSEWQNMQNNGYDRFWDCGSAVYLWKKDATNNN